MPLPERTRTRANGFAFVGAVLHAIFGAALLACYVVYVPAAKRTFDQYGMSLPWLSVTVIRVSNWVADNWFMLVPVACVLVVLDFIVIWLLARRGTFSMPVLWFVAVAVLLVGTGALTTYAVEYPMARLRQALAQ